MAAFPGFLGPSYTHASKLVSVDECINLFLEPAEIGGARGGGLYTVPGLVVRATCGTGPHRAAFFQDGRAFVVSGDGFYEIDRHWQVTRHGTVRDDGEPATIHSNGDGGFQLMIVSGGAIYAFRLDTDTFAEVTDEDRPANAVMGAFVDGYGLLLQENSSIFQFSTLEDFADYDPLDIAQKSKTSDRIRALRVDHGEVWLMGSQSIEPWTNTGDADTPFQPISGAILSEGLAARWSVATLDNSLAWIAENAEGARWAARAQGYNAQRISNHAVEEAWRKYATVADARAWSYRERGHNFYVVTFPTANDTWVYDLTTQTWHRRLSLDARTGAYGAYHGATHMYAFERHLVGSRIDGSLYEQTFDVHDFAGTPRRWLRRAPAVFADSAWVRHQRFAVHAATGHGLASGYGSDPLLAMQWSDDGGHTFGPEYTRSMGKIGAYAAGDRLEFFGLGATDGYQGRVYQVYGDAPVPVALVGAELDAVVGGR